MQVGEEGRRGVSGAEKRRMEGGASCPALHALDRAHVMFGAMQTVAESRFRTRAQVEQERI